MSQSQQPYIIGITGGSGSGKTLFLSKLREVFSEEQLCVLSQDNYYILRENQPRDENGVQNFDTPQSIDQYEFAKDIERLKNGIEVRRKEYVFNNPDAVPKDLVFRPAPIIVVEGIFVFYLKEVINQLNLKVFIDADDFLMLKRRIVRDAKERGYDLEDVLYRYDKHVVPTFRKYIEPVKKDADVVIPNNTNFDKGFEVLVDFIKRKLDNFST